METFFNSIFLITNRDKLIILYAIHMKLFMLYPNLLSDFKNLRDIDQILTKGIKGRWRKTQYFKKISNTKSL